MKKGLSALFIALITMAVLVSNVIAAPAQANKNAALKSVTYQRSGIVLLFSASGLSNNDLYHISFTAHSEQWNIACGFADNGANVRCVVSKKLSMFAGEGFSGVLAGFHFAGKLPSAREFPIRAVIAANVEAPATICADGQTLSYTFEYSNMSYQTEVWSDYYMNSDAFYSIYNVYPEYTSTYTDNSSTDTTIYYIYGYTTTTSGYGTTPANNWDTLVSAYESDGYTIQKTGESCD